MKLTFQIIYISCLYGLTLTASIKKRDTATILKYDNENDGSGNYKFAYETSDGSSRREEGVLRNPDDPEHSFVAVSGSYNYIGPDGITYTVTYIADENGFQPIGTHIPGSQPGESPTDIPKAPLPIVASLPPGVIATLLG